MLRSLQGTVEMVEGSLVVLVLYPLIKLLKNSEV